MPDLLPDCDTLPNLLVSNIRFHISARRSWAAPVRIVAIGSSSTAGGEM
jgi:hypothetical protein